MEVMTSGKHLDILGQSPSEYTKRRTQEEALADTGILKLPTLDYRVDAPPSRM